MDLIDTIRSKREEKEELVNEKYFVAFHTIKMLTTRRVQKALSFSCQDLMGYI